MARYEVRRDHIEPLWDRVDRNRVRLVASLVLFFAATQLTVTLMILLVIVAVRFVLIIAAVLNAEPFVASQHSHALLGTWDYFPWAVIGAGVGVLVYMAWMLTRDERWFANRMRAYISPRGEMLPTKYALKDMAIASGYEVAPALYVIETPNVNAFVFQRGARRAIVGVTRGMTERLTPDEQRAVFANLMARLQQGDMLWASAVTALMSPLWRLRDAQYDMGNDEDFSRLWGTEENKHRSAALPHFSVSDVQVVAFLFLSLFVVVSEFFAFGHRSSQLRHAETADAEGMLLLKDPKSMLSALEKCVRFNNFVPTAGPGMTQLFYAWTGELSTDDEDDPENVRIARLREVLGVEGQAPVQTTPNEPTMLVAPPAPRLEEPGATGTEV